ncbi:GNAT family N-acetyltransferase [Actinotalea fermentans]|uniref:N-acetyltransferase n=1 Tax=Actinotalea fermentans TaxID=43671 RepID=A0A511YTG7_9CELL|nr:GNAT family N-acetyltransferase [Actinotalea fermentans]KGM15596.1 GCN5 family acetyltransferase [Actinotalea fermentans ATCC 43279 = JCM 9966 = DSM 3133]GEN78479.1 N-acetyltransferase [Actinotalea fermentans]
MVEDVTEVTIRPATPADAERIAAVEFASWREAYRGVVPEEFLAGLDEPSRAEHWASTLATLDRGHSVWVADDEDGTVGFVHLGPSRDEDADRTTMEIYSIYLDPHAWGRGAARELMRTTLGAVPDGATVTLWALDTNDRARHFYRRSGFAPDGVEKMEEFGGEYLKEIRYRRG